MEAATRKWHIEQVNSLLNLTLARTPSRLSRKLLAVLWTGHEADAHHLEILCVKFGLFIPLKPLDEVQSSAHEETFLVPSLLPLKSVTEPLDASSGVEPLTCYFLFSTDSNLMKNSTVGSTRLCDCNFRFLPTGLFAHVIGQAIH